MRSISSVGVQARIGEGARDDENGEQTSQNLKGVWGELRSRSHPFFSEVISRDDDSVRARLLSFAILVTGSQQSKVLEALNWIGIETPPEYLLNRAVRVIGKEVMKMARESCENVLRNLPPGSVISFDGSWEHPRNSQRCITVVFLQSGQNKHILHFWVTSSRIEDGIENYCKVPQNMEVQALKKMIPDLMTHCEIIGYVHDKDAKSSKAIREAHWDIQEFIDPGHAMKCFERALQKSGKNFDEWVRESLRKWLKHLLRSSSIEIDEKIKQWHNAVAHLMGDHRGCILGHKKETRIWEKLQIPGVREELAAFLRKVEWILSSCVSEYSTQINESFNRTKLKYATKSVRWGLTFEPRMCCAILDRNMKYWKLELYRRLQLPEMDPNCALWLRHNEKERIRYKKFVVSEEYVQQRWMSRKACKALFKNLASQAQLYKASPYAPRP